jgi:hypothetical protein
MPWVFLRETASLADDPEWRGRQLGDAGAPSLEEFASISTHSGAAFANQTINIRIGWVDAAGQAIVDDAATATATPVTLDDLPLATGATSRRMSYGDSTAGTTAVWRTLELVTTPRGLFTVRMTGMAAAGADRARIWYWQAPARGELL